MSRAVAGGPEGEVMVWSGSLRLPASRVATLACTLSPEERARMRLTTSPVARHRYIAGRGQLRLLLARCLRISPQAVPLERRPDGKPILAPMIDPPLWFSVSHTGDAVVYGLSWAGEIGVDIERCRPELDWRGLSARFFAPREALHLHDADDFFRLWTRKEAMAKAAGGSLTDWLRTDLGSPITRAWRVRSWRTRDRVASVVVRRNPRAC